MIPPSRQVGAGGGAAEGGAPSRASAERTAVGLLAGWALLTLAKLLLSGPLGLLFALTGIETLALPLVSLAALRLARSELRDASGRAGARVRAQWLRTYGLHGVVLLLLLGTVLAQYQVLYALYEGSEADTLGVSYRNYSVATFTLVVVSMLGSPRRLSQLVASVADRPARLMAGSFGIAATVGALLLSLPVSFNRVEDASVLDAWFTAVSAVCVTGLSVNNIAETYSPFGQLTILLLMQIGGLGIMVLSTFFAVVAGRRLHARHAMAMAQLLDIESFSSLRRSLLGIIGFTLLVEAIGAVVLYQLFSAHPEIALNAAASDSPLAGAGSVAWAAIFHAVSAFCNAGFSLFRGGMMPFVGDAPVSLMISLLIVVGGLGFPVSFELLSRVRAFLKRERRRRLSLHSRVVLITSGMTVVAGAVAFLVLERHGVMAGRGWAERSLGALFQSITCRTAGFSTLDFAAMGPASWMIACVLMFIGASPGSTGGGAKTTTIAVLFATVRAELLKHDRPALQGRAISAETVRRAMAVAFVSGIVVAVVIFVLLLFESHAPAKIAFEAVSAVSTSGLSTGITSELSVAGRVWITLAMFVGRIGPLTLALAVADRQSNRRYRLVEERIAIG